MRYVKVLGLKGYGGRYDSERNLILVDFSHGLLNAFVTSFHEALHKINDILGVQDNVDLLESILIMLIKQRKFLLHLFFQTSDVIYLDKTGKPYVMSKRSGKWERYDFDPWELE